MPVHPFHAAVLAALCLMLFACAPPPDPATPAAPILIPYATTTRSPVMPEGTLSTPEGVVAAETPLPTPTPFSYTVQRGDTISSIALRFGVSMDDLQAANPDVSPNAMSVGQVLNIPSGPGNPSGEPTPTPAAFTIRQIECYPTADRGLWCFVLARNDLPDLLENLSAQVTLVETGGPVAASQTALLPLNILPPGASMPLTVFFPPEVSSTARPQVQVLTAIRLLPGDARYLPASVGSTLVEISAGGLSALVNGQVQLPAGSAPASQVWVAATAYDVEGRVVGVRRWESRAGLSPGTGLPFEFMISSLGGRIEQVEFAVEARP